MAEVIALVKGNSSTILVLLIIAFLNFFNIKNGKLPNV